MDESVLSTRRRALLSYIAQEAGTGLTPSIQDMADHVDVSVSTVHRDLEALEEGGWVRKHEGIARSVQVIELPEEE